MSSYLVETQLPRSRRLELPEVVERVRLVSEALTVAGTPARYLRSTFVPNDEVCLHLFEGIGEATYGPAQNHPGGDR